jgi:dolichol-phosphate mannosyltransferase
LTVFVIIPTYNEKENIQVLIPRVLEVFEKNKIDAGIIIVDDSSSDGTGKIAEELANKSGRVLVLSRSRKLGIGSAYKDGFNYALSIGSEGIIEMDADLSHDPSYIPKFINKLNNDYNLVIGSRYIPGGNVPNWTFSRRIISKSTNWIARVFLRLKTKDCTSGYRAYSSLALSQIEFSSVRSDGYAFQVEMVMRFERANLKICEIPITFVDRSRGKSKLVKGEMWQFLKSIIRLAFE